MAKQRLDEIIPTDHIVAAALASPKMKVSPRSAKRPTMDDFAKAIVAEIKRTFVEKIVGEVIEPLTEAYETFVLLEGEHADSENQDEWEEAADLLVEEVIEPWVPLLSQSWLGVNTIGSSLHLEEGLDKFANSLANEYYKETIYDPETQGQLSQGKILASAGFVLDRLAPLLDTHNNPTEKEKKAMADTQSDDLQVVLQKIADHIGKDHDVMTVYDDLDLASDDDDGLALGAAARLGIDENDVDVLRIERSVHGSDVMDVLQQGIEAIFTNAKPKKAAAPKKDKAPKVVADAPPKKAAKPVREADDAEGDIEPDILLALKNCGAADKDMAEGVGVSRATYNNYTNGKGQFSPTADQYSFIRGIIVDKLNELHKALADLDGVEAEEIY